MTESNDFTLSITRLIDAPREVVWRCWTDGDLLKQWYCPKPWTIPNIDIDVRPGGRSDMTMAGPEGERIENNGCYLEVVPQERLVFTDGYREGFFPCADSFMTGVVEFSDAAVGKTKLVWSARHSTAEKRDEHLRMGFKEGWNACADQLNDLAQTLA